MLGLVDLKIGMSRHAGARYISFLCLLLLCQPPGTSLTMEYLSESAPSHLGEDGGKFTLPPTTGWTLGGLPHGLAVADLGSNRKGNPLCKCFSDMHLYSLGALMCKAVPALLIEEEEVGHVWLIHLNMFKIPEAICDGSC